MSNIPVPGHPIDKVGNLADDVWYRYWKDCGVNPSLFTPTLTFGGAAVGMTYGTQFGRAFALGPLVFFYLQLGLTAKGASVGNALLDGLPFACSLEAGVPCLHSYTNMTAGVGDTETRALVLAGTTQIQPAKIVAGSYAQLTDADFTATSNLRISGWYYRAP